MFNCEVLIREDVSVEEFIDVLVGNRRYVSCLYVYNKIDSVSLEEVDRLARLPHTVVVSCEMDLGLDWLVQKMWQMLALRRIYTKKRGEFPDFEDAIILRANDGYTVADVCTRIHKTLVDSFKIALVWGQSAKYCAQRVGLNHTLADEDVLQIIKKI